MSRSKHRLRTPRSAGYYAAGMVVATILMFFGTLFTTSSVFLPQNAKSTESAVTPGFVRTEKFLRGLERTEISVQGREQFIITIAKRTCEARTDDTATSVAAISLVALLLKVSADQATKFTNYSRSHCSDLG